MNDCYSLHHSISIDPNGYVRPCCKFRDTFDMLMDYKSVDNIFSSKQWKKTKKLLQNGYWPDGCSSCKFAEENNLLSRRQSYDYRFEYGDFLLDISLGNFCNLKCRMCNEHLSTSWFADAIKLGRKKQVQWQITKEEIDKILNYIKNQKRIVVELKGGEPLINPNAQYFLEKISKLNIPVKLVVISNGTKLPQWFIDLSSHIEIDYQLSIDGVGNTYEYVRGDNTFSWKQCLERIKQIEELNFTSFSYNYVVQNLTIHNMYEFTKIVNHRINWIILDNPKYLVCNLMPEKSKKSIISNIEKIEDIYNNDPTKLHGIKTLLQQPTDLKMYNNFIVSTARLDKIRNQSLKQVLPHLLDEKGIEIYDSI